MRFFLTNLLTVLVLLSCSPASRSSRLMDEISNIKPYCGGEIYSYDTFTYGRIEARMRPSAVSGLVGSLFTFGDLSHWTEIDFEFLGKYSDKIQINVISGDAPTKTQTPELVSSPKYAEAFYRYAIEWTPNYIRWLIDDQEIKRRDAPDPQVVFLRQSKQTIHANFWPSRSQAWAGPVDTSMLPAKSEYDWIRLYDYRENANGTISFDLRWHDDFDTIDSSRWGLANWTFDGNLSQFSPNRVAVVNGVLTLSVAVRDPSATDQQNACPP